MSLYEELCAKVEGGELKWQEILQEVRDFKKEVKAIQHIRDTICLDDARIANDFAVEYDSVRERMELWADLSDKAREVANFILSQEWIDRNTMPRKEILKKTYQEFRKRGWIRAKWMQTVKELQTYCKELEVWA